MSKNPSVSSIQNKLNVDRETANKLRRLLDGRLDPTTFSSVDKWLKECFHLPKMDALRMVAANELLSGHGVEPLKGEWSNGYWGDIRAVYVNMGDTYANTLLYDRNYGFRITSYGDFVEDCERKGEVFA